MNRVSWGDAGKIAAAVAVGAWLAPVAATAAGQLMTIVDGDSNSRAQVDSGRLRVGDGGGPLTVDGTVKVRDAGGPLTVDGTVKVRDSAGPLTVDGTVNVQDGGGSLTVDGVLTDARRGQTPVSDRQVAGVTPNVQALQTVSELYTVPAGKTLVITYIGEDVLAEGTDLVERAFIVVSGEITVLGRINDAQLTGARRQAFGGHVEMLVEAGATVYFGANFSDTTGFRSIEATFLGYLVDV